jgi:hypothetical protein
LFIVIPPLTSSFLYFFYLPNAACVKEIFAFGGRACVVSGLILAQTHAVRQGASGNGLEERKRSPFETFFTPLIVIPMKNVSTATGSPFPPAPEARSMFPKINTNNSQASQTQQFPA